MGYIPTLDGRRTIAILFVMLNHDTVHHLGAFSTGWLHYNGRRGVELFFALSGILICTRLFDEEKISGTISLRSFYLRRVFRIQPAALTYLGVVTLLMLAGTLDHAYRGVLYAVLLVRNIFPLAADLPRQWYTAHFWSLSVEEHFYLLLPGFLLLCRRYRVRILLSLVMLLQVWKLIVRHYASLKFGWSFENRTDFAIDGILLSAAVAILLFRPRVRAWCVRWCRPYAALAVTVCVLMLAERHPQPSANFAVLCTYPLLIVSTMLHPRSWTGRLLELAPLRYIGRLSYSLYLWQMIFFTNALPVPVPHLAVLVAIKTSWLRYPVVLALSLGSYYLVEKPFIKIGHRLAKSVVPGRDEAGNAPLDRATVPMEVAS